MFTGIIEELGKVNDIKFSGSSMRIFISANKILSDMKVSDSICVNGVCLTVIDIKKKVLSADVIEETFKKSNLSKLKIGDPVNLERALKLDSRISGHIVSGHIDGTGIIRKIVKNPSSANFEISCPENLRKYIAAKGSVSIDGISLTVAEVYGDSFRISLIPFTSQYTTLGSKKCGDILNIETDLFAKYVHSVLQPEAGEKLPVENLFFENTNISNWLGGTPPQWN